MRPLTDITLPDGSIVQPLGFNTEEFWQRAGVDPRSNLEKLKGGHARKVMALAGELYPDQVKLKESS